MPRVRVSPPVSWHGVILAGGVARRFGRDKVFARVGGRRLIDMAYASLAAADGVSVLLGTPERAMAAVPLLPTGVAAFADDHPGHGPMGGLASALGRRPDRWAAALAADLPLVPAGWWPWLADQHRDGAVAVVPRDGRGRWEPLAALYHGSLAGELTALMVRRERARLALQPFLDELDEAGRVVVVDPSVMPTSALLNVNRPDDAAAVERAVRRGEGPTET